ncbi:EamA family transporter [Staphylococcus equorum]|uniref:EamA family transporter n=1 Tax=Staphylococcus equorum TaxID=246432 RepID=UPI000852A88E|nr:EamA family transporter [Staphylococcus equorum]OEK68685.1 hypothetical protein AST02_08620 [Staphylococcus equorum]
MKKQKVKYNLNVTMSLFLTPAVSLILAYLLLGEVPSIVAILGGIITLIGVTITCNYSTESVWFIF